MDAQTYTAALATLGLHTPAESARWLGVSLRTAQRYAVDGPSGPVAVAVSYAVRWHLAKANLEASLEAAKINDDGSDIGHAFCRGVIWTYNSVRDATNGVAQ